MAVFFLLVGLEVNREWLEGRLASPAQRRLPIVAALSAMAIPASAPADLAADFEDADDIFSAESAS